MSFFSAQKAVRPLSADTTFLQKSVLVLLGTFLLAASSKFVIPYWPVNGTLQTLAVVTIGFAYGSTLGTATVALYLIEGAFGIPVFTGTPEKGLGFAYMMGPSGGFLLGFLPAVYIAGYCAERGFGEKLPTAVFAGIVPTVTILAFGYPWLAHLTDFAIAYDSFTFYLAGTVVKAGLATAFLMTGLLHKK